MLQQDRDILDQPIRGALTGGIERFVEEGALCVEVLDVRGEVLRPLTSVPSLAWERVLELGEGGKGAGDEFTSSSEGDIVSCGSRCKETGIWLSGTRRKLASRNPKSKAA